MERQKIAALADRIAKEELPAFSLAAALTKIMGIRICNQPAFLAGVFLTLEWMNSAPETMTTWARLTGKEGVTEAFPVDVREEQVELIDRVVNLIQGEPQRGPF